MIIDSSDEQLRRKIKSFDELELQKPTQIFEHIYENGVWGGQGQSFFSGAGSHLDSAVEPYVRAVRSRFEKNQFSAVDIGCGDFAVGGKLYDHFQTYIGIDCFEPLISALAHEYVHESTLHFEYADITAKPAPQADIYFVREVFQHLSNQGIHQMLENLRGCKWLVVTEVIPKGEFESNRDQPSGPFSRLVRFNSGVRLEDAPFNLEYKSKETLLEVPWRNGVRETVVYEISP